MKRLLIILGSLTVLAVASAGLGILLSRDGNQIGGPRVLVWRVTGGLPEREAAPLLPLPGNESPVSLAVVHRALSAARVDPNVRGLALYIEDPRFGLAKAQELRRQIAALRAAGKFVHCYLETAGEGGNGTLAYYLAAACDRVELAASGELNLLGLYADSMFLRGTLDKLKIEPDFHHVGIYKSGPEMFTEYERSPAVEEAVAAVLDGFFGVLVQDLAADRRLTSADVRRAFDTSPMGAEGALGAKLVDQLAYADEFLERVKTAAGGDPELVSLVDYRVRRAQGKKVAVLFAEGTIVRGDGGVEPWTEEVFLGSREMATLLGNLREDESVVAVVLRIDSPGGSALASDLILHEVARLREAKPVVVSMSDLAASGGYYIAARANKIVAEPMTLTGSIGVYAGKLATRQFQNEVLGISHDVSTRGANADFYSALDPFPPAQAALFQARMQETYDTFVGHVAAGRQMDAGAVEQVAQGRVWIGTDAERAGLVDELGGLDRALDLAREAASVTAEGTSVLYYPPPPGLFATLFQNRNPELPPEASALLAALRARAAMSLELPRELRALARPF